MRLRTKADGLAAAKRAISEYKHQAKLLGAERSTIEADEASVTAELAQTWAELASELLVAVDAHTLQRLAGAIDWPQLANRRGQLEAQRSRWAIRLKEVEADPNFTNRATLLEPKRGTIDADIITTDNLVFKACEQLAAFEVESFTWLSNRELSKETWGGFDSFMHAVTMGGFREARMQKKCCVELGYDDWAALKGAYDGFEAQKVKLQGRLKQLSDYRKQVEALAQEQQRLYAWVYDFEAQLLVVLRSELAAHLEGRDPEALRQIIQGPPQVLLAKAHALAKKKEYFVEMRGYLSKEVDDRNGRVKAINSVRSKWSKRPSDRLVGDKSKWLIALPKMKRDATKKRLRWTRSMHESIYDYNDYDDYNMYMGYGSFLAYDAFAHGYRDRVPYEGFSRGVLSELDTYRDEAGQEKADYAFFKGADGEGAAAAAQHDRDEAAAEAAAAATLDEMDVMSEDS